MNRLKLDQCFDANNLDSIPTKDQQEVFKDINKIQFRFARGGNQSGKSQVLRREVAWIFEGKHPHFTPPEDWAEGEPLQILLVGKTRRMLEDSLWNGIKKFLTCKYKETKVGPHLEKITNLDNGNTIILLSHDNPSVAVERIQSYTAHYIGLDEMPTSYRIIEELQRRGQAKAARFLASFTPKAQNVKIKQMVDALKLPHGKVYRLRSLDNPVMDTKKKDALIASLEGLSESFKRTILEGDWMIGERAVYQFNADLTVAEPPQTYSKGWRHVESVDPASSGEFGFTLWAEDPADGIWYCVRNDYWKGPHVPQEIFEKVQETTKGYNIIKRISDPHEVWYIQTASANGVTYTSPFDKNSRKNELIKGLQTAIMSQIKIAPWCEELIEEFSTCQYREDSDKIVNATSYHLLDTAQYFVDLLPKYDPAAKPITWHQHLREKNELRKEKRSKKMNSKMKVNSRGRTLSQWNSRRSRYW